MIDFKTYQELSKRTMPVDQPKDDRILNCLLGLSGETGEILDLYKKNRFQQHELKLSEVAEEVGDVLFYLANLCTAAGLDLGQCALNNYNKLLIRYPNGFSPEDSIRRVDKDADK